MKDWTDAEISRRLALAVIKAKEKARYSDTLRND